MVLLVELVRFLLDDPGSLPFLLHSSLKCVLPRGQAQTTLSMAGIKRFSSSSKPCLRWPSIDFLGTEPPTAPRGIVFSVAAKAPPRMRIFTEIKISAVKVAVRRL